MTRRSKISGAAITPSGSGKLGNWGRNAAGQGFWWSLFAGPISWLAAPAVLLDKYFMLIHSVFFWLKPGTSEAQRVAMRGGLESLRGIKSVESIYIGEPAQLPDRPTRDSTYAFALTVLFKDIAAHDAYQIDPLHKAYITNFGSLWDRVQVYDAV